MTSNRHLVWVAMALFLLACGCKDDAKTQKADTTTTAQTGADAGTDAGPQIIYKEGPKPTDETVLARSGDTTVLWSDYQHGVRLGRLFAPSLPDGTTEAMTPAMLATPHSHIMMTRSLLSRKLVMEEVARRGIEITDDEVRAYLKEAPRIDRWAKHFDDPEKLEAELGKLDVTVADFMRLGREQLAQERLRDALVAEIEVDGLWPAYQYENNTVQIIGVEALNVPSGEELDAYVNANPAEIEKYYEEKKTRYTYPARGEATVLVPPPEAVDPKKLEKAAAELAAKGADPEAIAEKYGFSVKERQLFTQTEDARIFAAKIGETGFQADSPRGAYAWLKTGDAPPAARELGFGLKREIAAAILRDTVVTTDAREKLAAAKEKLAGLEIDFGEVTREQVDPVIAEIREMGLEAKMTPSFPRAENGFVPGFGIHENLAIEVFNTTKADPYPDEPVLSRNKAFTFRLVGRTTPSKEEFEKEKEAFAESYRQKAAQGIVDRFIQEKFSAAEPQLSLDPIKVVYGELQKPR